MDATEIRPDAEELAALQEQVDDARAEIERLQRSAANDGARAEEATAEAAVLRADMLAVTAANEAAVAETTTLRTELETTSERSRIAAQRYRDLVVRTEPALPADLIAGDDVDAIDASVKAARDIVGRVRSHIESQAQAGRVPAGAPPRSAPDLSALTPEQKIRYGLAGRQ